jgi:hypothetical protein
MIFRVPESYEGSFVLSTISKALWAGMEVSIVGNDLYAPDVKIAVKRGILVPINEEAYGDKSKVAHDAMVVNKTDNILVLGDIVLNPWASLLVEKDIAESSILRTAESRGLVHIVSDEVSYVKPKPQAAKPKVAKTKKTKKPKTKKAVKKETPEQKEPEAKEPEPMGEDREVTPMVWDMRKKTLEEAKVVPKTPDIAEFTDEQPTEEVEFVDSKEEPEEKTGKKKKKAKKKKTKKKTKKASVKKTKKKEKTPKKKKVKAIQPVGEVKQEKTAMEASMDLDDRGKPRKKASDELQHLIDSITGDDITFVDKEQQEKRLRDRFG